MSIIYQPTGRAAEYSRLALNVYNGCSHGCTYCYAPAATHNINHFTSVKIRKGLIENLRKEAPKFAGTKDRVLLCFTCDPYQPIDEKTKLTRQALQILRENNIPFQILTKGGLRAERDFDLYGPNDAFATTLTLLDIAESRKWEPLAAEPAERLLAIQEAHTRGIQTWVSLEPVLDPKQSLEIIEVTKSYVDHYKLGKLNHFASDMTDDDWRLFGYNAVKLCEGFDRSYYVKADLAVFMSGIPFTNTDTRRITPGPAGPDKSGI